MTSYQEHIIVMTLADIIREETMNTQPSRGQGLYLKGTWLTPQQCYTIAKVIEEHNDALYGEGKWKIDRETVEILKAATK